MNRLSVDEIQRTAEMFANQVETQSGTHLDFDLPSLARLDTLLSEWLDVASVYDSMDADMAHALAEPVASYIGEVLVRSLGAQWIQPQPDNDSLPILRFSFGQKLDLGHAVGTVLRGLAPPAFHELATTLQRAQRSANDEPSQ